MELHSYAKRRVAKKWTIEQKRKLVEVRISQDAMFSNEPRNSVLPWKKILSLAKLDDYNVFFVRKQWSNMVARYKQYKQNRLGNIPSRAIDNEMIQKISQEWEFFQPIHHFMTRKTTNLHSYALKRQAEPLEVTAAPGTGADIPTHQSQREKLQQQALFSSDTNDDFTTAVDNNSKVLQQQIPAATDHDFYVVHAGNDDGQQQSLSYFADASDDTQDSMVVETCPMQEVFTVHAPTTATVSLPTIKADKNGDPLPVPLEQVKQELATTSPEEEPSQCTGTEIPRLSERDKYYRHKRRFNRRLERRFDSILNVFGQIVRAEYPSIDVSPLLGAAATNGSALMNRLFSSDDDDEEEDENSGAAEEPSTEEATQEQLAEGAKNDKGAAGR